MTAISITDLTNAKLDVDHIAEIATSLSNTAIDRLGHTKQTMTGAIGSLAAITSRGAWVTATAYFVKDLVSNSGTWYVCVVAHTSSAAFATDTASKWRVYQGLLAADLSASSGASLVGYMPAGTGAVATTVKQQLLNIQAHECHVDDAPFYGNLQSAVDSIPYGGAGKVTLGNGANYSLTSQLNVSNRAIVFEGNNSTINLTVNATHAINIDGSACEVRNITISKSAGVVVTAGIYVKGSRHVFRNVSSFNCAWPILFHLDTLVESHFSEIRVDNDPSGFAGNVFRLDNTINNTFSDSFIGFCNQGVYGGLHNEGWLMTNVIIVYAGKAVNGDNATFFAIDNCIFDFCETQGVFFSNGQTNSVKNTWIASNNTNGFIGVGCLNTVGNMQVSGCTFAKGGSGTHTAFSLNCDSGICSGNSFIAGANGGLVYFPTSQLYGNSASGGGTNVSSVSYGVSNVLNGGLSVDLLKSFSITVTAPNATTTPMYTFPNALAAMYMVTSNIGTQGSADFYGAFAIVKTDAGTASFLQVSNSSKQNLTLSGLSLNVTQTSTVSQTVTTNILRLL